MSDCSTHAFDVHEPKVRLVRESRVYIIGPVTGIANENREAFEDARKKVESYGYRAEIPHDTIPKDTSWKQAMRQSIRRLVEADTVVCLDGWGKSRGATIECRLAFDLGIPVTTLKELATQMPS